MIETLSQGSADDHMDEQFLLELSEMIARHPWWQARAKLTLGLLKHLRIVAPSRILDAGCGWGVTLSALERAGFVTTGLDVSRKGLERLDRDGRRLIEADLTQPFDDRTETFDAVLALDVIEHLDDDSAAVKNLAKLVKPGGVLIVSVPALPEMWSEFDTIQGHRRRYDPKKLRAAFAECGLDDPEIMWWGEWLAGRLKASRSKPRMKPGDSATQAYRRYLSLPRWPASLVIRAMFAAEQRRALKGKLAIGSSLFAYARKRPDQSAAVCDGLNSAQEHTRRPLASRPLNTTIKG